MALAIFYRNNMGNKGMNDIDSNTVAQLIYGNGNSTFTNSGLFNYTWITLLLGSFSAIADTFAGLGASFSLSV